MSPYDRTGDDDPPVQEHRPGVDCAPGGWLHGHTPDDDQPAPCLICRPHLHPDKLHRNVYGISDPGPTRGHGGGPERAATETSGRGNPSSIATRREDER